MAVNINTVYTTVLYILNKEQRGYIPPAEFNSLAVQVQNEIFESYFPDGNQVNRLNQSNSQNDTEFFNMFKDISYKLFPFENETNFTWNPANLGFIYTGTKTIYKLGEIIATTPASQTGQPANIQSVVQLTSKSDYTEITKSKLTLPTANYPICFTTQTAAAVAPATVPQLLIKVSPASATTTLAVNCLFAPSAPSWGFTVGTLGQYIYNSATSVNFELDIAEQNNLIINILKYAGIIINNPQIVQAATQESQQEEINLKR